MKAVDEEVERENKRSLSDKIRKEVYDEKKRRRDLDLEQRQKATKAKQIALNRTGADVELLEKVRSCHSKIKGLHLRVQIFVFTNTNICIYTTKLCIYKVNTYYLQI